MVDRSDRTSSVSSRSDGAFTAPRLGRRVPREFDKLVRDRIPERIRESGETPVTHVADEAEYRDRLAAKLVEEAEEFREDRTVDELADVEAVLDAIRRAYGVSEAAVERERRAKAADRGEFADRVVLECVEE